MLCVENKINYVQVMELIVYPSLLVLKLYTKGLVLLILIINHVFGTIINVVIECVVMHHLPC